MPDSRLKLNYFTCKRSLILIIAAFAIMLCGYTTAEAHFVLSDGSIGAVLHIDPNDDPVAGSLAVFNYEIKDKNNQFNSTECNCVFTISANNIQIDNQKLFSNTTVPTDTAITSFTLPSIGVYIVTLTGTPMVSGQFQPFTLVYNLRVSQIVPAGAHTNTPSTKDLIIQHTIHGLLFGAAFVITIVLVIRDERRKKHSTTNT